MKASVASGWHDASGLFSPIELRVIALAAGSPGECKSCESSTSWSSRFADRMSRLFAFHRPQPLANDRLEALRRLACASFALNGREDPHSRAAALSAGISASQVEGVHRLATDWRPARR